MTNQSNQRSYWSAAFGVLPGMLVALFVYLPATWAARAAFDVPIPNPTPREQRAHPVEIAPAYWAAWGISLVVLAVPGLLLISFPSTRRPGIGYLAASLTVGGIICAVWAGFEIGGFAPTGE